MSPHYDFDAPRFQKVVMVAREHSARGNRSRESRAQRMFPQTLGLGKIREYVVQLVRMFAGVDVDFHRALETLQLIRARVGNDRYH
jgi:hypothetical protein